MALTHPYLTLQELQDLARDQLTAYDTEYERAIAAASRQIDGYCGRHFWKEDTPSARTFRPDEVDLLWTGDFATTDGLVVKTDEDDDGVCETTWSATDWQAEPFERMNDRPYERIAAVGGRTFPVSYATRSSRRSRRARVEVSAQWGWPEIPAEVKQACAILALDHFKSKDLSNIASQYGTGTRFTREVTGQQFGRGPRFNRILAPVFNPEAEALLQPLRVVVVA